jgi:hypothetical protein
MQLSKLIRRSTFSTVAVALMTVALNAMPAAAAPADPNTAAPGANLLTNPSHEHPGVYFAGRGEINVTWNWVPFWEESPQGVDARDQNYRTPEFRPVFASVYPDRVHSGGGSERWFNFFALNHAAGVMQLVNNLPVGKPVRFSTWAQLWSSNVTSDPPKSTDDGNMRIRICVQTDGGPRNMVSANLKCSDWAQPYDKWQQIYVDAVPISSTVIALVQSDASLPVQHNDAYVDDSCFEVLPAAGGKSVCLGAGYVPSGAGAGAPSAGNTAAKPAQTGALQPPAGTAPKAVVVSPAVNVRASGSTAAAIIGGYRRGDVVDVSGKSADGKWFQVSYKDGAGWVFASLVLPNDAAKAVAVAK